MLFVLVVVQLDELDDDDDDKHKFEIYKLVTLQKILFNDQLKNFT